MPFAFAYPRHGELAQSALEFVCQNDGGNDGFCGFVFPLSYRQGHRNEIARMTRILFPVNVIEIQSAYHQTVQKRGIVGRDLFAACNYSGLCFATHVRIDLPDNINIVGGVTAKRAADRIVEKALDLLNDVSR